MLLRLRVSLPDRPGSLGQVARTLGVVGADIVAVVVLERVGGRAVDDVTVVWPASAAVDRIVTGLTAIPGVRVDGVWRGTELSEPSGGREVALIGQMAANPANGLATIVDAAPALFGGDWAAALKVSSGWVRAEGAGREGGSTAWVRAEGAGREGGSTAWAGGRARTPCGPETTLVTASWRAPVVIPSMNIAPLRPRAVTAADGTYVAVAPFQRGGLVLVVARGGADGDQKAPPFHGSEVERLAQLVNATAAVLGDAVLGVSEGRVVA